VVELLKSLISTRPDALRTANLLRATNTAADPCPRFVSVGSEAPVASRGKVINSYMPLSAGDVTRIDRSAGLKLNVRGGTKLEPSFRRDVKDGDSPWVVKS